VSKTNLGAKRICPKCSARFYDLGKNPAACPKCGTMHDSTAPVKPRRGKSKAAVIAIVSPAPAVKAEVKTPAKPKKPVKAIEGIDLEEFEDIEPLDTEEEIEEIEEIEDIDSIGELEEIEDPGKEAEGDEAAIEGKAAADTTLIDGVEEAEEGEDEEEDTKSKKGSAKSAAKGKKKPKKK